MPLAAERNPLSDPLESRLLGELKRVQRDCDEACGTAWASIEAKLPAVDVLEPSQQCRVGLLEQRFDQFQQTLEEKLQAQRRDFEQRLLRISSSNAIAASATDSSLVQHGEQLCALEGSLDDHIHRSKALTEGVMRLSMHVKQLEQVSTPRCERSSDEEVRSRLEELANRIQCQELAHARLYANVFYEGDAKVVLACGEQCADATSPPIVAVETHKVQHLEAIVDKLAADMIALEADTKLVPQVVALLQSMGNVAPKLQEHQQSLTELHTWREEQLRDITTIMIHVSAMEKQLERSFSSTLG